MFRCATFVFALFACATVGADVVIEGVTIVSPELAKPLPSRHVLIRGDRIAEISARPIAAANAERINGSNRFLTPGIMDSHVHLSDPPGLPLGSTGPALQALREAFERQQPRSYLYFGVTQVLDASSYARGLAVLVAARRMASSGLSDCAIHRRSKPCARGAKSTRLSCGDR